MLGKQVKKLTARGNDKETSYFGRARHMTKLYDHNVQIQTAVELEQTLSKRNTEGNFDEGF